jgi:hypothetical protein
MDVEFGRYAVAWDSHIESKQLQMFIKRSSIKHTTGSQDNGTHEESLERTND